MPDPTGRISHISDMHRGFSWKPAARMASTVNLTLSGLQTIDGIVGASDDIVLVKNQTAGAGNGLYWMRSGAWVRHASMDQDTASSVPAEEVMGAYVAVIAGTLNAGTLWRNTNTTAPTLGTTALTFVQVQSSDLSAIDFLVGTASASLSGEIVVGTAPGGELGGTWASPTVDTVHSGSAHASGATKYEPLTSGVNTAPEPVYTAAGRMIMVPVAD